MKSQTCDTNEGNRSCAKVIERDGKFYVVKLLPPADCSGETFSAPTANVDGANFRRYMREIRDEKTARRGW